MSGPTDDAANLVDELRDYNLFATDPALKEAVARAGAAWHVESLHRYGERIGRRDAYDLAESCNRHPPELHAFDNRGRRIDRVEFHPSWHALLGLYREQGLVSQPFSDERLGRWSAFAAGFYLHGQVEAGTLCPATMTLASIPVLMKEPALFAALQPKLWSNRYDARDVPVAQKESIWIGMGMTEKQGGSDVRSNTTAATPLGSGGRGAEYTLTGHKWFFSAPMCDAHLVVAKTDAGGHSCFYVPRWRADGSRNAVRLQRLKQKVGNRSNASSEVEFDGASGILLGDEGRGIPTIIEMATHTRLSCVLGSAALMRQALVQALHYARRRFAFGKPLMGHPLMRSVLADLALESEAALQLAMRLAQAFERGADPAEQTWKRVLTPAAKFWVCKRAVELTGEAMEVFGGNGYVDDGVMARLYREAPVNSIWEGSGNVMCLDMLRGVARDPEAAHAWLDALRTSAADDPAVVAELSALQRAFQTDPALLEAGGRRLAQRLVLVAQAGLLREHSASAVADAFIETRFGADPPGRVYGAIDTARVDVAAILARAFAG